MLTSVPMLRSEQRANLRIHQTIRREPLQIEWEVGDAQSLARRRGRSQKLPAQGPIALPLTRPKPEPSATVLPQLPLASSLTPDLPT